MEINCRDKRIKTPPEMNDGPVLVEVAGYQSRTAKITQFLLAGERLIQSRIEAFEYPAEVTDINLMTIDPTRRPGFDRVDADQILKDLDKKITKAKADLKAAEAEKAQVKDPIPKPPQTATEPPTEA